MTQKKPKISIITACFNSEKTIKKTFDSILNQSLEDVQWIVIDGGSTDGTLKFLKSLSMKNVTIISEKDSGVYDAMNKGIKLTKGSVVHFLNSDDYYSDNTVLEKIWDIFRSSDTEVVAAGINYLDDKGKVGSRSWTPVSPSNIDFENGWQCPHPGFFLSKELLNKIGKYNLSYDISSDYDFTMRAILRAKKVVYPEFCAVTMFDGGLSSSWASRIRGNKQIIHSLKSNGFNVSLVKYFYGRILVRIKQFI
jgi:glycosyltransferase involved in cell wall biosynthesis